MNTDPPDVYVGSLVSDFQGLHICQVRDGKGQDFKNNYNLKSGAPAIQIKSPRVLSTVLVTVGVRPSFRLCWASSECQVAEYMHPLELRNCGALWTDSATTTTKIEPELVSERIDFPTVAYGSKIALRNPSLLALVM